MQKTLLFLVGLIAMSLSGFSSSDKGYNIVFDQTRGDEFTLDISLMKYDVQVVEKNGVQYSKINFDGNINLKQAGWAELPFVSVPIQLGPQHNVDVEIISSSYVDIPLDHPMLPSRGVIYRNQEPSEIPYQIDPESIVDEWYPSQLHEASEPYILRKVRGQNVKFHPFRYNAIQQTLRVYTQLRVKVSENDDLPINPLPQTLGDVNVEMEPVYRSLFVNYNQNPIRWAEEIGEFGDILVIYTSRDATAIQPWIEWKQQKGYHVEELEVSTGTNVGTDIQNAYDANNNILYVLLVGDWAEIKSDLGGSETTPMDPMLGCVVGTDDHHDIIIGRFSAESTADVTAQGNKAIEYERDAVSSDTWYKNALGIASSEGTGDDGEYDNDQIENIHNDRLLATTYTTCHEQFDPSASASGVQTAIDGGVSVINYCGHGANTYWVSSGYSVSEASSSTNGPMYPYAFSVACVVGAFHSGTCFAEAMLRNPDGGAVATWMSTMNQPWQPPMRGQDYANDLLIQGFDYSGVSASGTSTTYGRTTFGSITYNAAELMVNESDGSQDWDTYYTWTIFGDPSFQVRTDQPKEITLSNVAVTPGSYTTQVQVEGSGFEGAIVSLWQSGSQPASAITDASGNVTISHSFNGTVKLTVTGFNLETYHADHVVAVPNPPICDFSANQTTITAGGSVQFTDNSTNSPSVWDWTFNGGTPASSADQNPVVMYDTPGTYDVSLYASNTVGNDTEEKLAYITVNPVTEVPVSDFEADVTTVNIGGTVNFTDLSTNLPDGWFWTFDGGTPSTSTVQNPSVQYDTPGTYQVNLMASNSIGDGNTEVKVNYITVLLPDYCDAAGSNANYEYISNVVLGTIDNASDGQSYTDFTAISTDAYPEDDLSLVISNGSGYNSDQAFAWADWNRDGDFEDVDEELFVSATGTGPYSTTITVPAGTTPGAVRVRLRIEDSDYSPIAAPCGNSTYGEVEDYTINVFQADLPPVANFTADQTTIPEGGTVNFTDLSENEPTSYAWTFDGGTPASATTPNPSVTYNTAGTYDVTLYVQNTQGNDTKTETAYITVTEPAPTADFTANPNPSCDGVVQFTDASTGATSWEWNFGDGNTSTEQNPEHTYAADGTYTVDLTATNAGGSDTHNISVTVEMPNASIDAVDPMCVNASSVTLTAATAGGTWSGDGVSGNTFDPSVAGYGDHIISYEVTIGTCTDADQITIHVDGMPDATITTVADQCENGTPVALSAATTGGTWIGTGISANSFDPTIGEGDYTVSYEVSLGTCTATDDISIHVDALPNASIDPVGPFCTGDAAVTLNAATAGGTWSGNGVTGNSFDPVAAGIGTHTVSYEVSNGGCTVTAQIDILVSDSFDATINAVDPLCENSDPIALTAATAGGTWSGSGVTGDQFNPATAGAGFHLVSYDVGTGSCADSDNILISVQALPEVSMVSATSVCLGSTPIELEADVAGGTWSGDYVSGTQFDHTSSGIGAHVVTYTVVDGACTASIDATIYVGDEPAVNVNVIDASTASTTDGSVSVSITGGLAPYSYAWSNGDIDDVMANVGVGTYSLTVTDAAGCETIVTDIIVDFTNSINVNQMSYAVYPNPANDMVYVEFENMTANRIELVNMLGQTLLSVAIADDVTLLNLESYQAGVYFIRIHAGETTYTEKLMVD